MKKVIVIAMALALVFSLAACSKQTEKETADGSSSAETASEWVSDQTGVQDKEPGGEEPDYPTYSGFSEIEEAVGLENGESLPFEEIGAVQGKSYLDGSVELYEFSRKDTKDIDDFLKKKDGWEHMQNEQYLMLVKEDSGYDILLDAFEGITIE